MKFLFILTGTVAAISVLAPAAQACAQIGEGSHIEGRVWVTEYRVKIGETCMTTFARSINQSTAKIDLTDIKAPAEVEVKIGKTKDDEPTMAFKALKEGQYEFDYYLSVMIPARGVEAHWQRSRLTVTK